MKGHEKSLYEINAKSLERDWTILGWLVVLLAGASAYVAVFPWGPQ